jgi:uncharacterized integral membrane protein
VEQHSDSGASDAGSAPPSGRRAKRPGVLAFLLRHPVGVLQTIAWILVAVIVLQNVEPTSIHLLFWSVGAVPKLVVILVAMLAGAVLWEVLRRLLRRSRGRAASRLP